MVNKTEYEWALSKIKDFSLEINVIAEIGSRDGLDAISLGKIFQSNINYIFEADPTLIQLINKNIKNNDYESNFEIFNVALGNHNKVVEFLAVDTKKYDNLGVGSLFEINFKNRYPTDPDYNRKTVQEAVNIDMKKYAALNLKSPDLIAMDVQGGELEVLKGFEHQLSEVKFIILESSISENYIGGSKFSDVHNFLKENFKLLSNSRYRNNNLKLFFDNYKYQILFKNKYQPDFNLLYVNKEL